jgi:predicted HicB family RNase H-like nuclease
MKINIKEAVKSMKLKHVVLSMPRRTYKRYTELAHDNNVSLNDFIVRVLKRDLLT